MRVTITKVTKNDIHRQLLAVFAGNARAADAALAITWPLLEAEQQLTDRLAGDLGRMLKAHGCSQIACKKARETHEEWRKLNRL